MIPLPPKSHNNPPGMVETINDVANDLNEFLKEHPVIENGKDAAEAKVFIDRAKLGIQDLEAERDGKVRPLNEQVKEINAYYRGPRSLVESILDELQQRITGFLKAEERKRIEAAREAARLVEVAELAARDAERAEQDALISVAGGELGVDIKAVVVEADRAFAEYQKAERQAVIAERDTKVKIGGGFSRALGLKEEKTIVVRDFIAAVQQLGPTEHIVEAIKKSARMYKKLNGQWPAGIEVTIERKA